MTRAGAASPRWCATNRLIWPPIVHGIFTTGRPGLPVLLQEPGGTAVANRDGGQLGEIPAVTQDPDLVAQGRVS